ncbi:MAG: OpgC domain-containing protein [Pseudomonadota bacterium]
MKWQLLFVHAMALGVYKDQVFAFFSGARGRLLFWVAMVFAFAFWMFAMNNPNPGLPAWAKFDFIEPGDFWPIYGEYFSKSKLGLGRVMNNAVLFVVAMGILTRFWYPIQRALGWFAIPIGQASLYVFVVHVFFVLAASLTPWHESGNFWINTALHLTAIAGIWLMVRHRVLFNIIPR